MTSTRVLYVIDDQRPGYGRWVRRGDIMTATAPASSDGARQIAERFELSQAWIVSAGRRVRLRVWAIPEDWSSFEPDDQPADGTWIYEPQP